MSIEIERKWLLTINKIKFLEFTKFSEKINIFQYYIDDNEKNEVRFRKIEYKNKIQFFKTIKRGKGLSREEIEIEISKQVFDIYSKFKISSISKNRYIFYKKINDIDYKLEFDSYLNQNSDKFILEIEFLSEQQAHNFKDPKQYFNFIKYAKDVTNLQEFKNSYIAKHGFNIN